MEIRSVDLGFARTVAGIKIGADGNAQTAAAGRIRIGILRSIKEIIAIFCIDGIGVDKNFQPLVIIDHDIIVDIRSCIEIDGNTSARFGRSSSPAIADQGIVIDIYAGLRNGDDIIGLHLDPRARLAVDHIISHIAGNTCFDIDGFAVRCARTKDRIAKNGDFCAVLIRIRSSCPLVNQESSISTLIGVTTDTDFLGSPDGSGPPVLSTCVHLMVTACALSH